MQHKREVEKGDWAAGGRGCFPAIRHTDGATSCHRVRLEKPRAPGSQEVKVTPFVCLDELLFLAFLRVHRILSVIRL